MNVISIETAVLFTSLLLVFGAKRIPGRVMRIGRYLQGRARLPRRG